jgi:AcrR family transcriptional regulator
MSRELPDRVPRLSDDGVDLAPWTEVEDTPKSRRHPEKREAVVLAALELVDREGFDALSMRAVARELRWGTMTLYSYVRSKDELMALMSERLGSELLIPPGELPADWRGAIKAIAFRTRAALLAHPWVVTVRAPRFLSPSFARHIDQTFEALAPLGVDMPTALAVARAVDDYTMGATIDDIAESEPGPTNAAVQEHHLRALLEREDLPHLRAAIDGGIFDGAYEPDFERGLDWLLAGIAAALEKP